MILDFILIGPLIVFALLGFRDGIVRKGVGIATAIGAMFLAHEYMQEVGEKLTDPLSLSPSSAPIVGFLVVLFTILLLQSLIYRLAGSYRIGGFADRIAGSVLGLFQGALIVSIVLAMLVAYDVPSRRTTRESRFYSTLVNIAPQLMDFTTTVVPGTLEKLEERATPLLKKMKRDTTESENVRYLRETEGTIKSRSSPMDSVRKINRKK